MREIYAKVFTAKHLWTSPFLNLPVAGQMAYLKWMKDFSQAGFKSSKQTYMLKMLKANAGKSYAHYARMKTQIRLLDTAVEKSKKDDDQQGVKKQYVTKLMKSRMLKPVVQHNKAAWEMLLNVSDTTMHVQLRTAMSQHNKRLNTMRATLKRAADRARETKEKQAKAAREELALANLKKKIADWKELESVIVIYIIYFTIFPFSSLFTIVPKVNEIKI